MATYSIEVVATTTSAGGAAYKIVIDSTDCVSGRTLVQNRAVAPSNTLDWGFYGNVISIPKGQMPISICVTYMCVCEIHLSV